METLDQLTSIAMRPASSSPSYSRSATVSGKSRAYETHFNEASALLPEVTETNCPTGCAMGHSVPLSWACSGTFSFCHYKLQAKAHWLPECFLFQ